MSVYLDHAASSPLRREVLDEMLPHLTTEQANPSSPHGPGRRARMALDEAHERLAASIGARPRELVFTSGGTEAINLALKGAAWAGRATGHRLVTSSVEHKAVLESFTHLESFGFEVLSLPVDRYGRVEPDDLSSALDEKVVLVSLQLANNEVGTISDVRELCARVRSAGRALVHLDAVQGAAWLPLDVGDLEVDLVSFSAHKVEGPKGRGALWLRRGTAILPQLQGGSQERHRRAGTEDVAGAVGMAAAFELASRERADVLPAVRVRRDRLAEAMLAIDGVELTGHPVERLPGLLSVIIRGLAGDDLVMALDLEGVSCSTGSACTTGSAEPSHVLTAMGYPADEARGSLRLSLGRSTSDADVDAVASLIPGVVERLRQGSARLTGAPGPGSPGVRELAGEVPA
ncbi:cysteine desulfurase family protein [soil metagenome]